MSERGLSHYVVHDSVVEHLKGASEGRKLFNEKNSKILMELPVIALQDKCLYVLVHNVISRKYTLNEKLKT